MSVTKKFLLAIGGAAVLATGIAGTASAHVVAAGPETCEAYARQYAAANAPQFGLFGWNAAYRRGYNECVTGGPDLVSVSPAGYRTPGGPFAGFGAAVTAPVALGANVAGAAVNAGATVAGAAINAGARIAGAALSIPGAILGGTATALAPAVAEPVISPTAAPAAPVVTKNYRGTYETVGISGGGLATTSALAVPASSPAMAQGTPEWHAYCAAKYRSYNPDTGTYLAYSGTRRACS